MAFGYSNPLAGKSFGFGNTFPASATGGKTDDYFDVKKYGGDIRSRNKAVGRQVAGNMGVTLTDQQIENLGSGIADIKDLVNQKTQYDGGIGSANYEGALTDDRVNQYLQSGDLLGSTGWGGIDGGSAFGTMRANADAAKASNNQDMYKVFTDPSNFSNLGALASRTMGGVGQSMLYDALGNAQDAYSLGQDPYAAAGGSAFGNQTARWVNPHTQPEPEPETGSGNSEPIGNTPSTPVTSPVAPVGGPTGTMPDGGMGLDDINHRFTALTNAFTEAQGIAPDPAQSNYLMRIANDQGLDAAVSFAKNNIVVKAVKASGHSAPKIRNSQDVTGANALYDFIMQNVPGGITQDKQSYVSNLLSWYQSQGM